ncbi:hypothetical protein NDA03_03015 [Trichocoleus sp. Lan]|uniref:hypothetical protein n=1 Tax=Trichocoleus sp. Lan TaxID=2933927 RepID=UPI003296911F
MEAGYQLSALGCDRLRSRCYLRAAKTNLHDLAIARFIHEKRSLLTLWHEPSNVSDLLECANTAA